LLPAESVTPRALSQAGAFVSRDCESARFTRLNQFGSESAQRGEIPQGFWRGRSGAGRAVCYTQMRKTIQGNCEICNIVARCAGRQDKFTIILTH